MLAEATMPQIRERLVKLLVDHDVAPEKAKQVDSHLLCAVFIRLTDHRRKRAQL